MWLQSDVNYTQGLIVIGIIIVNARDKSDASDKSIVTMSFRSPPSDPRQVTTKHDRSSREYATTSQRRRRYARRHIASMLARRGGMRLAVTCNVGKITHAIMTSVRDAVADCYKVPIHRRWQVKLA